jgi:hypothetical protein
MRSGRRARPLIVLFSRSGFKPDLVELAKERDDVRLVEPGELVQGLVGRNYS